MEYSFDACQGLLYWLSSSEVNSNIARCQGGCMLLTQRATDTGSGAYNFLTWCLACIGPMHPMEELPE